MSYSSDEQRKAAHARKMPAAPPGPQRVPLSRIKRKRVTANQAEVAAEIRHARWLIHQWRRREPDAFRAIMSGLPLAHTDLATPDTWSPDEHEQTQSLVQQADAALTRIARKKADEGRSDFLNELKAREHAKQLRKQATHWRPARLLRELEGLERSLRWTPRWDTHQLRSTRLQLNAVRAEARRRGLRGDVDA